MTGERTVYVKVGINADPAIAGLRQLKRSLDGIAQQDLGRPRSGLAGLGKVNDSGLRKVSASMNGIAAQDFRRPQAGLDGLFTKANLVAGGLALGVGKAVSSFADFDQQMSAVSAATGLAGDGLNSLRQAAIVAGADTQYSATEAASAITEMSKAGLDATEILGGGLTGALNLAAAGQMNTAEAAETMATALAQFKLDGDQATHVADLLAAGAGKAQGSVSDMGMALKQAGLVASASGLSIEETTAGLAAFANAGLIGSDAGTSFKSMLQRLTPTSDEAAGVMEELNINAYDAQGNFVGLEKYAGILRDGLKKLTPEQRNSALATVFGSDAVRAANVLYEQGATGIAHWTSEVNQQGFAAKQAAALTDNLRGDMERLGGAVDTALIQGGSGANNALRELTKTTEGLVVGLSQIPAPLALGATALAGIAVLGPKIGESAKVVTGPLKDGMQRFREEMALHRALATQVVGGYQRLGDESLTASGKVGKSAVAMSAARSTIGGLKGAAGGLLNVLGGPWGLALAGATAAVGIWAQKQADAKAAADALNATMDQQTGQFTKASKETTVASLMDGISPEDVTLLQRLGVNFNDLADAALKGGPAFEQQKQKYADLANEHRRSGGLFDSEANALEVLVDHLNLAGTAAEVAAKKQEILNQVKNDAAVADSRQAGSTAAAERNTADLGTAVDGTTGAMQAGKGAADDYGNAVGGVGDKAKDAKKEMQDLLNLVDSMAGGKRAIAADKAGLKDAGDAAIKAAMDRGGNDADAVAAQKKAQEQVSRAQADLTKARNTVSKKGVHADTTAAERRLADAQDALAKANQRVADSFAAPEKAQAAYEEAMRNTAAQGDKLIHDLIDQKKPISEINAAYDAQRAALIKAAEARGFHGKAAEAEADKVGITGQEMDDLRFQYAHTQAFVDTQFRTPGLPEAKAGVKGYYEVINGVPTFKPFTPTTPGLPKAKGDVDNYVAVINGVPQLKHTDVSVTVNGLDALRTAAALLSVMPGAFGVSAALQAAAAMPVKKAAGGAVFGPGTGTSDSIPAMLSNGEHVLTAAEVAAAGGHGAIFALRKAILSGGIQFRAAGGPAAPYAAARPAPVTVRGGAAIDYARLGAAVAAQMPPLVSVHSGKDAQSAARSAINDWEWGQVQ